MLEHCATFWNIVEHFVTDISFATFWNLCAQTCENSFQISEIENMLAGNETNVAAFVRVFSLFFAARVFVCCGNSNSANGNNDIFIGFVHISVNEFVFCSRTCGRRLDSRSI